MSCKCASYEEDEGRYTCSVSGSGCMFMSPDSMSCAILFEEGPDVGWEEKEDIKMKARKYK